MDGSRCPDCGMDPRYCPPDYPCAHPRWRQPGQPTLCGGCAGAGRVFNPNSLRLEKHSVCGGEGMRR